MHDQPVLDYELKELKNEPIMNSDKCTARLFFRNLDEQRTSNTYTFDELIDHMKDKNQDAYDKPKKFTFCVDLKEGCYRGIGKVS